MTWTWAVAAWAMPQGAIWGVTGPAADTIVGLDAAVLDADGDGFDDVVVGAHGWTDYEGAAAAFSGSVTGPSTRPSWVVEGGQRRSFAGSAVEAVGDVDGDGYEDLLVGASDHRVGQTKVGAAALFRGGPTGLPATPDWVAFGDRQGGGFGRGLVGIGDVDGDGYDDVAVAAPWRARGQVQVFLGGATGLAASPDLVLSAPGPDDFGFALAAGDLDGDGYGDLVVGADGSGAGRGEVYAYLGGPRGLSAVPDWSVRAPNADGRFGGALAVVDVDGDGDDDVAVGAPQETVARPGEGVVRVYLGSPTGPGAAPALELVGGVTAGGFGTGLGGGDLDGDGFGDLGVGAVGATVTAPLAGAVAVFHGSAGGLDAVPLETLASNSFNSGFGSAVCLGADTDGDGVGEVLVGAYTWSESAPQQGAAFLFEP